MQSCICPCLAIFVTVFVIVFVFVFVIVVATLVSRSSQVIFVFVFFFFLSSLYLSWPNYTGLKIFASCGDSYFAFKLQFIVQQKHHCFYQKNLPILWCWMNVFDDSIKSNGGFECLSPNLNWRWMWRPQKYSLWMESSNCEDNIVLVNLPVIIFSVWTEFELN